VSRSGPHPPGHEPPTLTGAPVFTGTQTERTLAEPPTVADALPPESRPQGTGDSRLVTRPSTALTGTVTVARALLAEEAARCRSFGMVIALLSGSTLAALPFLGGEPWLQGATQAALLWLFGVAVWVWRVGAREEHYSPVIFRIFGWSAVLASIFIDYHLGVFSPAPMAVTLGISFFALSDDRRLALQLSSVATASYLFLVVAVLTGFLPDDGLLRVSSVPPRERVYLAAMVPSIFLVTLLQARESRAATHGALHQAQRAMLLASQQEARVQEARADLDVALRAGAGRQGRYSGQLVAGYHIEELIGRGAMGEVYAASDLDGRPLAVKMLAPSAALDEALLRRFLREGELSARLRSPHIVRVFRVGEADDGAPFIAMERLRGADLGASLRKSGRLPLPRVVELVRQVAIGLDAAHAAGVIHRDLKPQNLFFDDHDGWKIVDFGVSKLRDGQGTLTQRAVVGTPGYMAPEQAQGLEADPRSDIFALGAVAYRALTDRPPFAGPDTPQILFAVCYRQPLRPSSLVEGLPPDVDDVLAIALAKSPDDRFASASAFASALDDASRGVLDDSLRARAAVLVDVAPWGHRARQAKVPA